MSSFFEYLSYEYEHSPMNMMEIRFARHLTKLGSMYST